MATPWLGPFLEMQRFREVLASVSLSHDESCGCDTCKAAQGDDDAFGRLYARHSARLQHPEGEAQ